MDKKKRLIRSVCVAGMAGALAVGAVISGMAVPCTKSMTAEIYYGEAEHPEVMEGQAATVQAGDGNLVDSGSSENPVNLTDSDVTGTLENPDIPGISVGPGDSEELEIPVDPKEPGQTDTSEEPEKPGESEEPEESDQPDTPEESEEPDQPDTPEESEEPDQPDTPEEPDHPDTPEEPEKPEKPVLPGSLLLPQEREPMEETARFETQKTASGSIGNASLIRNQKLVKLPKIIEDFRFWTVARKYAFAREDMVIREAALTEGSMGDAIRVVGKLSKNGLLYILKEEKDGWFYVESGRVRGFVRAAEVITGEEAVPLLEAFQNEARENAGETRNAYTGIESVVSMAEETVPWQQNQAFTYLRATAGNTVAEKDYAIAKDRIAVREDKSEECRAIGIIPESGLCYILADKEQEWVYIESGDVRGFVRNEDLRYGTEAAQEVEERTEEAFSLAEEKIKPEENGACYYTLTSTKPGVPDGELRRSMIEFAAQFVGNPYVWGGASLTDGADCSGFVQSIYRQYGYHIPRVAHDQAHYGTQIPVEDALPGDLIFYAHDGYIHHVVMYAGGGKTIEAMSSDTGIVQTDVKKESAVWACRILEDQNYGYEGGGISNVNASPDMYGTDLGTFKLTYYCACELCCDVETGITATGAPVVEGRTIAVDPKVIPYGTKVIIGGHVFTAEDCGGAVKDKHIDIYVNHHETAQALGVNYAEVYLKK